MPRIAGTRSASLRLNEVVIDDCETIWTIGATGGTSVLDDDATVFKVGAESAELILNADATAGIVSYSTGALANTDLSDYTHVKYWIRSTIALAAGDFKLGFSDAADQSGTEYYVDIPAIAANTWTRVITDLTSGTDPWTNVSSASSIHLNMVVDKAAGSIFLDDIRLCNYELSGDADITLPETTTYDGEILQMPFRAQSLTVHEVPQDIKVQYRVGSTVDTHSTSDGVGGYDYIMSGQTATDLQRVFTNLRIVLSADLGAADYLSVLAQE
jgi:hypothetical protein